MKHPGLEDQPPHGVPGTTPTVLAAERALLGAALIEPQTVPVLRLLSGRDFHKDGHRLVHSAILALTDQGRQVDAVTVAAELEAYGQLEVAGGPAGLALLLEEAAVISATIDHARVVVEAARKRTLARVGQELAAHALNGVGSPELLIRLEQELTALTPLPDVIGPQVRPGPIDATELAARPNVERNDLVDGILPTQTLGVIGGDPKLGKTALLINLKLCLSTGSPWLGFATRQNRILLFQAEVPEPLMADRLRLMQQELPSVLEPGWLWITTDRSLRLDEPEGQGRIRAFIEEFQPAVVGFDPLARFMTGDENASRDMGRVVRFLDELIQRFGVSVLLVHHTKKPGKDDSSGGGQRLRGSSALFAAADSVLMLERQKGGATFSLTFQLRHAREPEPLILQRTDSLWFTAAEVSEDLQAVVNLAGAGKRFKELNADVQELLGHSRATATRLIGQAKKLGLVTVTNGQYRARGLTEDHGAGEPEVSIGEF